MADAAAANGQLHRYPLAPLLRAAGGDREKFCREARVRRSQLVGWMDAGLTARQAEPVLEALGLNPVRIWPDWQGVPQPAGGPSAATIVTLVDTGKAAGGRRAPKVRNLHAEAAKKAMARLKAAHAEEWLSILNEERAAVGLPPTDGTKGGSKPRNLYGPEALAVARENAGKPTAALQAALARADVPDPDGLGWWSSMRAVALAKKAAEA